jgi:hypothetical protein
MGILSTMFYYVIPFCGAVSFVTYKVGKDLPKASKIMGRRLGMGYNYFKVILKLI